MSFLLGLPIFRGYVKFPVRGAKCRFLILLYVSVWSNFIATSHDQKPQNVAIEEKWRGRSSAESFGALWACVVHGWSRVPVIIESIFWSKPVKSELANGHNHTHTSQTCIWLPSWELRYHHMIFLFPRWDMLVPWWLFEKCPVCFQQYIMEHCRAKHVCSGKSSWKSSDVPLRFHGDFILKYLRVQKCKVYYIWDPCVCSFKWLEMLVQKI